MSHLKLASLLLFALPMLPQQLSHPRLPRTLSEMRDRYRPLLIFAPGHEIATKLSDQVDVLQMHRPELLKRQILLVPFFSGGLAEMLDSDTVDIYLMGEEQALRRQFHIRPYEFTVILLGKDGTEKLRSDKPISFEKLRDTIDGMPMRRQEIKQRPTSGLHAAQSNVR